MQDLTFERAVGAAALLLILGALIVAALLQGSHDALVALISLVTGAGIGTAGTVAVRAGSPPQS